MEDDLQEDNASGLLTNQDASSISNIGSATQSAPDDTVSDSLAKQDPSMINNIGSATQSAQNILEENIHHLKNNITLFLGLKTLGN